MTEKQQVDKIVTEVFSKNKLEWVIASVEENKPARTWDIEVEVPDGPELLFSVPKGSPQEMKEFVKQQVEEEIDRLGSR